MLTNKHFLLILDFKKSTKSKALYINKNFENMHENNWDSLKFQTLS